MDSQRAYSVFQVRAIDEAKRTFSGVATTPSTDRIGDSINPLGVIFKNPLVLLHQHDHREPIGQVVFKKPTAKGIEFTATIPKVDRPGLFRDRVDMAWDEISYEVVRAVSIGFRPIEWAFKDDGGIDYQKTEVYELSPVSVPALPDAIITTIKSMGCLPIEIVRSIKLADAPLPRDGSVKLIRSNRVGSVKLTK